MREWRKSIDIKLSRKNGIADDDRKQTEVFHKYAA